MQSEYEQQKDNRGDYEPTKKFADEHDAPRIPAIDEGTRRHVDQHARSDNDEGDKPGDKWRVLYMEDKHGESDR